MDFGIKVSSIFAIIGVLTFIVDYTRMTKWAAWKDEVGFTIIIAEIFVIVELIPLLIGEFFDLDRLGQEIETWFIVGGISLTGVAMLWRTFVFEKVYRRGKGRTQNNKEEEK